jgi:LysR family transcriptional regulator, glycine cleavage system transcriptional activator
MCHGFMLAQNSMVCDDIAAGRLVMPFPLALPLPWPYILTWKPNTFEKPHCRVFQRWLVMRGKKQQQINQRMVSLLA